MPHILVTSNCQTAGIAATLAELFPEHSVSALPLPEFSGPADEAKFAERLKSVDVWVTLGHFGLVEKYQLKERNPGFKLVKAPPIGFSAFHPDLCYAKKKSTGELVVPHYNSAIVVWAYQNGVDPNDATRLFNRSTFEQLGYLNAWNASVAHLRQVFTNFGMGRDFDTFYLRVKRHGNFMYSINHPRAQTLVQLGKIIATKIGAGHEVFDRDIQINDGLTDVVWPVYLEVADGLALDGGSYSWKMGAQSRITGVRNFVDFSYDNYLKLGISPRDLEIAFFDGSRLDAVLAPQITPAARTAA